MTRSRRVAVVSLTPPAASETFIAAHVRHVGAGIPIIYGTAPLVDGRHPFGAAERLRFRVGRRLFGESPDTQTTAGFVRLFERFKPDAVLAEFGEVGVRVTDACARMSLPLVVHFHGYDAWRRDVLAQHATTYPRLFQQAAAVIGVSREMIARLESLGCPPGKLHYIPCGVDCDEFDNAQPAAAPPVFLAVGRLTEKKGPLATIAAFKAVAGAGSGARLRIIGDGRLRAACELLIRQLRLEDAVTMMGVQPPHVVAAEMRQARAFVQHSLTAATGDREGTPVAVMEAGASGLPVVATRHAGIPDVVVDGETGLLVDEGNVAAMAGAMRQLADDPLLAARLGRNARERVRTRFSRERTLGDLDRVLDDVIRTKRI